MTYRVLTRSKTDVGGGSLDPAIAPLVLSAQRLRTAPKQQTTQVYGVCSEKYTVNNISIALFLRIALSNSLWILQYCTP